MPSVPVMDTSRLTRTSEICNDSDTTRTYALPKSKAVLTQTLLTRTLGKPTPPHPTPTLPRSRQNPVHQVHYHGPYITPYIRSVARRVPTTRCMATFRPRKYSGTLGSPMMRLS